MESDERSILVLVWNLDFGNELVHEEVGWLVNLSQLSRYAQNTPQPRELPQIFSSIFISSKKTHFEFEFKEEKRTSTEPRDPNAII